jgi:hypothetical protein
VNGGRERTEETSAPVKRVSGRVCTTQTSKGRERERDRRESRGGERRERGEGNCDGAKLGALLFFPGSPRGRSSPLQRTRGASLSAEAAETSTKVGY